MPRNPYRREPASCVCQPGNVAHHQHCKPGKTTGAHLDPRCPHSELRNTTSAYEQQRAALERQRRQRADRERRQRRDMARLVRVR